MAERPRDFRLNYGHTLAQGLVFAGLGRHSGTTHYRDSSLYGNHGTLTSMDPATDWEFASSLRRFVIDFDGSNDNVSLGTASSIKPTGFATWAVWIKNTNTASSGYAFGDCGDGLNRGTMLEFGANATSANTYVAANVFSVFGGSVTLANSALWTHYAMVFRPSVGLYFYENGRLNASFTTSPPASLVQNALPFKIGDRGGSGSNKTEKVSDLVIYNRALSAGEICALADPSNAMLSGLVMPPTRRFFASAGAAPTIKYWLSGRRSYILGGGLK